MAITPLSAQSPQAISTLLAQLKAEQAKTQTPAKPQSLQALGAQIVQSLETSFQQTQTATSSDALSQLLNPSSADETDPMAGLFSDNMSTSTQSTASTPSVSDLAAQLKKTAPGPAGDQARAAILATLTAGQNAQSASSYTQASSLFSFLG